MSDRVAVFDQGRIQQVGTPHEVYEQPATEFVARFVGTSNLLEGGPARTLLGQDGSYSVRPERVEVLAGDGGDHPAGDGSGDGPGDGPGSGAVTVPGTVVEVVYAGATTSYLVDADAGVRLTAASQNRGRSRELAGRGDRVRLRFERADCRPLDPHDSSPVPTEGAAR